MTQFVFFFITWKSLTAARSHSLTVIKLFSTEQSNTKKRMLVWEHCLSDPIASVGESWDRIPKHYFGASACVAPVGIFVSELREKRRRKTVIK